MKHITVFSVKEFKNEFRLICTDTWGCAMDAWFEAAGQLHTRWLDIPAKWQYKAVLSPLEEDNYFHDLFNECTDDEIIAIGTFLFRYCQYLKFKGTSY